MHVPSIVLIEMIYLVERGRLDPERVDHVFDLLDIVEGSYIVAFLDQAIARALRHVLRAAVPDMPDRIITATAFRLGLPLITRDMRITASKIVAVVW
jgi:predicted nucleic acid-binding protein